MAASSSSGKSNQESKSFSVDSDSYPDSTKNNNNDKKNSYHASISTIIDSRKEFPMFIAMADLCVTPTGFIDMNAREALCNKIHKMSGEVGNAFTSRTTHLVAAHSNTSKVEMARERSVPVMTIEWVENIWNACQKHNPYLHASLPQFQYYDCPVFYNLHFVFSKEFDFSNKEYCQQLVQDNGGIMDMKLKNSPSTYFYICHYPEKTRTFHFAKAKKIPCLYYTWIVESVNINTLAPGDEFEVRHRPMNMTYDCQPGPRYSTGLEIGANYDIHQDQSTKDLIDFESTIECDNDTSLNSTIIANAEFDDLVPPTSVAG